MPDAGDQARIDGRSRGLPNRARIMASIGRRLEKLEQAARPGGPPVFVWREPGETVDAALARHRASCPQDAGRDLIPVEWLAA